MTPYADVCPHIDLELHESKHSIPLKVGVSGYICVSAVPAKYTFNVPQKILIVYIDKSSDKVVFLDDNGNPVKTSYSHLDGCFTATEGPILTHTLSAIIKSFDRILETNMNINFAQFIDKLNESKQEFPEKWL